MHPVGKMFLWPKAITDECWYSMQKVIAQIPEPVRIRGRYHIDSDMWEKALGTKRHFKQVN